MPDATNTPIPPRAARLLELARPLAGGPGPLTEAEERLLRAAAMGECADFRSGTRPADDPARAADWAPGRVLRANRIAWLCTDPEASALVARRGIWAAGARIEGDLDVRFAAVPFPLRLEDCAFRGALDLQDAQFRSVQLPGCHTGEIRADGLRTEGSLCLNRRFRAEGAVRLSGAQVGGNLTCRSAQFLCPDGTALSADGVRVKGDLRLNDGFRAEGAVSLLGVAVGKDVDCDGGQFLCPSGDALCADGLRVDGCVFLRQGFRAEGVVRLRGAAIGGDFSCLGGRFVHPGQTALMADGVKVEGAVFLRNGFHAEGRVSFMAARIGRFLFLSGVDAPGGLTLDLRSAHVGSLCDEAASWPAPGQLLLHGLVYEDLDDRSPLDAPTRLAWLRRQPAQSFRPQPYEHLAAVLKKHGLDEDARQILIAKNDDRLRLTRMPAASRAMYHLLGGSISYGYRPWRAFRLALLIVAVGTALFSLGFRAGVLASVEGKPRESFNALLYSLDTFLPIVDLHQKGAWWPAAAGTEHVLELGGLTLSWGALLRTYQWIHIGLGWILTTLLVASLSGLIRR